MFRSLSDRTISRSLTTTTTMDNKSPTLIVLFYLAFVFTTSLVSGDLVSFIEVNDSTEVNTDNENPIPIVGVMTQEVLPILLEKYPNRTFTSYVPASYVKFVEGAGGRVVPIWINKSREYYEDILSKINGVLLPGGVAHFNNSNGYGDAGRHIYDIAMRINDAGTHFPIWGTCLGLQFMIYLTANETEPPSHCSSSAEPLPLEFTEDFQESRMFCNASSEVIDILENYAVTSNFHSYCYTNTTFAELVLNNIWRVMSVNQDWEGTEFISTIEHRKYPFYGIQFHPEKNLYEFVPNRNITHTTRAVIAAQYFADFFIGETRLNRQKFHNKTEETESLIYNYSPAFTGLLGSLFMQQYLFGEQVLSNDGAGIGMSVTLMGLISMMVIHRLWL